ncbi:GGDEF domain-containing protein [Deinococcus sp. A31D244]|uniref:GGDEF domain-containing protein n=1 Tax=Deinococcus sp. A31D244 TaxID=3397675 RepID=UPI0039E0E4C5
MLDVDHFKRFNDVHGHAIGDAVLRRLGSVLSRQFREEDIACRYGGEEFLVLLPGCTADAALERAEVLRRAVGSLPVAAPGTEGLTVTVPVGIAVTARGSGVLSDLIAQADQALYAAKRAGRDRVKLYGDQ